MNKLKTEKNSEFKITLQGGMKIEDKIVRDKSMEQKLLGNC